MNASTWRYLFGRQHYINIISMTLRYVELVHCLFLFLLVLNDGGEELSSVQKSQKALLLSSSHFAFIW